MLRWECGIAMDIVDVAEGYEHYADAMAAYDILDKVYNDAKEYCMPLARSGQCRIKTSM